MVSLNSGTPRHSRQKQKEETEHRKIAKGWTQSPSKSLLSMKLQGQGDATGGRERGVRTGRAAKLRVEASGSQEAYYAWGRPTA